MEKPGRLQSMGSLRVGHDWATSLSLFTQWRRKWQPAPVFLPGESHGRGSLVGCHLWGRTESDTTEATQQQQQQQQQQGVVASILWLFFFFFFLIKKFIFWLHHTNIYLSSPTGPPGKSLFWLFKWTFYTKQLTFWHPHFLTYMLSSAMWSFRHLYRCRGVEGPLGLLDQPYLHLLYLVEKPWALLLQYI